MPLIRTPDERFVDLPDFPYAPRHEVVLGRRVHYVDEGTGDLVVCLHGEPTWAFLYRKMIPALTDAGLRVVAPDFVGFGRSDKYTERAEYSFQMHYETLEAFFEARDLRAVNLVVHDWGGLIGLSFAARHPGRVARLIVLNTFLPTGEEPVSPGFKAWRRVAATKELVASRSVANGTVTGSALPQAVLDAYDAPFPDARFKAGMQTFPLLVPLAPEDPGAAELKETRRLLQGWAKPAIVIFSTEDMVLGAADGLMRRLIPTAGDQPKVRVRKAGHFLQEDNGEEVAGHVIDFLERTS